jgi:alpha-L-fucosidase
MKPLHITLATIALLSIASGSFAQTQAKVAEASPKHPVPAIQDTETKVERNARMEWWRKARFGMFIHWGL